jgi:pimeloyl-ACP methyl ester carboxylesterase
VTTTYKHAQTDTVDVGGARFAYRQLGADTGVPVIFLVHLAGNLDNWDPRVVDGMSARHGVITFDNRGVGASTGKTPDTIQAMAKDAVTFIRAQGFDQVDLHGFSMGGMIAQVIAQDDPELVRKLILTGTGPAGGKGMKEVVWSHKSTPSAPAESPGPEAVPLLHPDRERQAGGQGVPGSAPGAHDRPRHADHRQLVLRATQGLPPLGQGGASRTLTPPPARAPRERR